MSTDFSKALTLLRQEKGVSQRIAAGDLGISQALLSHYENGIREPGLDFLCRACDYYEVSADYVLARTTSRAPQNGKERCKPGCDRAWSSGDDAAKKCCSVLCDSLCILMRVAGKSDDPGIVTSSIEYMELAVYKVFRHFYNAVGVSPETFFSMPTTTFLFGTDSALKSVERSLVTQLSGPSYKGKKTTLGRLESMSRDSLEAEFPEKLSSLLQIVNDAGELILHQTHADNR